MEDKHIELLSLIQQCVNPFLGLPIINNSISRENKKKNIPMGFERGGRGWDVKLG